MEGRYKLSLFLQAFIALLLSLQLLISLLQFTDIFELKETLLTDIDHYLTITIPSGDEND